MFQARFHTYIMMQWHELKTIYKYLGYFETEDLQISSRDWIILSYNSIS